jgi:hypothetical protein
MLGPIDWPSARGAVCSCTARSPLAAACPGPSVSVVRGGLNNPRHLTLTSDGLWVAQAGAGGPAGKSNCVTGPSTGGTGNTQYCVGQTGAVSLIRHGHIATSVSLPSVIQTDSSEVAGPGAVAFSHGRSAVIMQDVLVNSHGVNALPKPAGKLFGQLLIRSGHRVSAVNIAAYAAAHPQSASSLGTVPGETAYDSDPYDVVAYHGGFVVADAAANSLLQVSPSGRIHLLARFPAVTETAPAGVLGPAQVTGGRLGGDQQEAGRPADGGQTRAGRDLKAAHQEQGRRHDPPVGSRVTSQDADRVPHRAVRAGLQRAGDQPARDQDSRPQHSRGCHPARNERGRAQVSLL